MHWIPCRRHILLHCTKRIPSQFHSPDFIFVGSYADPKMLLHSTTTEKRIKTKTNTHTRSQTQLKFINRARATYHHVIIITQAETFNFTHSKLQCNWIKNTEKRERKKRTSKPKQSEWKRQTQANVAVWSSVVMVCFTESVELIFFAQTILWWFKLMRLFHCTFLYTNPDPS